MTIDGAGHTIKVSGDTGNNGSRDVPVFSISSGTSVTLSHLSIISGTNGIDNYGQLMVQNSTLADNSDNGIWTHWGGQLTAQNSTISGNGTGIYTDWGGRLTVQNSTISGNGTGIYNDYPWDTIFLYNTLIANSGSGGDCINGDVTADHVLIEDSTSACGVIHGSNGNIIGQDPNLGPLADNGGDTWTHALLTCSPAIDAGNDALCLPTDQRGILRPQGAGCDIGAFEKQVSPLLALIKTVTPTIQVPYHGIVTYTMVLSSLSTISDTQVALTDTLPAEVDFAQWVQHPGANVNNDEITWSGVVSAGQILTFTFQVSHTGSYGDHVTNTVRFRAPLQVGSATAIFSVQRRYNLVVYRQGQGAVTSYPTGIACGTTCTALYTEGTPVTLTATSDPGSFFAGWSGNLSGGQNPGLLLMDGDKTVTATFSLNCIPVLTPTFTFAPNTPLVGQPVWFIGTVAAGTAPLTYTWQWGDGTPNGSGPLLIHTFPITTVARTYTVTLSVSNPCAGLVTDSQVITVKPRRIFLPLVLRQR